MAFHGNQKITILGEEFTSLSNACTRFDLSYRALQRYADKHGLSDNIDALNKYAAERKQIQTLMRSLSGK